MLELLAVLQDAAEGDAPNGIMDQWSLVSYAGIVLAVVAAIGALKKLFSAFVKGKEPHLALMMTLGIGVLSKLTIPGAFSEVEWLPHIVALLIAAAGSKLGHDYYVNKIVAGKSAPDEKKEG